MRVDVSQPTNPGEPHQPRIRIESVEDYEQATRRIAALDSSSCGETEKRERAALVEAVAAWDALAAKVEALRETLDMVQKEILDEAVALHLVWKENGNGNGNGAVADGPA